MRLTKAFLGFFIGLLGCLAILIAISVRLPISASLKSPEAKVTESQNVTMEKTELKVAEPAPVKVEQDKVATQNADAKPDIAETTVAETDEKPVQKVEEDVAMATTDTPEKPVVKRTSVLPTISTEDVIKPVDPATEKPVLTTFGAFEDNAQVFANVQAPVFSIILINDANQTIEDALVKPDFYASYAVSGQMANARAVASSYHGAGFEVMLLNAPKTRGGLASIDDVAGVDEVLERDLLAVPKALGVLDSSDGELQKSRVAQTAVLDYFEKSGHALLSYKLGLDSISREAQKRAVPSISVFRVVNENDTASIARDLGLALLEAGKEGSVIVTVKNSPQNVAAIEAWVKSGKAKDVVLGPISAAVRARFTKG